MFFEELRKIKPVLMLAEGEAPELHTFGFNMTYSSKLYWLFNSIAKKEKNPQTFAEYTVNEPRIDLLSGSDADEAYLADYPGNVYVIYFPNSGNVKLNLADIQGTAKMKWISVSSGEWGEELRVEGEKSVAIESPASGGWLAVIRK